MSGITIFAQDAQYGDYVLIPLDDYTPKTEAEVREAQQEQARRVLLELGVVAEVEFVKPRVLLAWCARVQP